MAGHYDASLLGDAPVVTKAMRQEGYNPDLLQQQQPLVNQTQHTYAPMKEDMQATPARVPFWRTTKGFLVIAVLVLVIIGAVVGGAVGGTQGHKKSRVEAPGGNSTESAPGNTSSSPSSSGTSQSSTASSSSSASGIPLIDANGRTTGTGIPLTDASGRTTATGIPLTDAEGKTTGTSTLPGSQPTNLPDRGIQGRRFRK